AFSVNSRTNRSGLAFDCMASVFRQDMHDDEGFTPKSDSNVKNYDHFRKGVFSGAGLFPGIIACLHGDNVFVTASTNLGMGFMRNDYLSGSGTHEVNSPYYRWNAKIYAGLDAEYFFMRFGCEVEVFSFGDSFFGESGGMYYNLVAGLRF
ncbi:MAG TPA: hypothetical protein PKK43_06225, partial [Spirochaetota bacterium]|nr:hypothetical protein [Spirochaetota bacterium]